MGTPIGGMKCEKMLIVLKLMGRIALEAGEGCGKAVISGVRAGKYVSVGHRRQLCG